MGELIAVLSGKGGTGKTSVCAGISTALAKSGKRVLCIDCDIGLRNLDISLGLAEHSHLSFWDICTGHYTLEQLSPAPYSHNLFFLTAPVNQCASQISPDAFRRMLQQARHKYDYIFLDAPAGIEEGFRLTANSADLVLLVTGPDPAAIRDAAHAGDLLELMGKDNVRLVVNRVHPKMVSAIKLTIDDVMDQTGLPLMGIVPEDPNVLFAAAAGTPLLCYTLKGAAPAFRRIARRIQGFPEPVKIRSLNK